MMMDMCLPKFDIYKGAAAQNYFKSHTDLDVLIRFLKIFCLFSVWNFRVRRNIVSTGQSVRAE